MEHPQRQALGCENVCIDCSQQWVHSPWGMWKSALALGMGEVHPHLGNCISTQTLINNSL